MANVVEADEERNGTQNAEAAVDETPIRRYAADRSGDEGERNDPGTGDDAELEYPLVADSVDERTDEGYCDGEVSESQPVCTVGHEWIGLVCVNDAVVDAAQPAMQRGLSGGWRRTDAEDLVQDRCLAFEWEGRDSAKD